MFLLLAAAIIIIFRIVWDIDIIFGWIGGFIWAVAPFIYGFAISYVLNIPRERIEHLLEEINHPFIAERKRGFSLILTLIFFVLLIVLVVNLVVPRVYESIMEFIAYLPTLIPMIENFLIELDQNYEIPFFDFQDIIGFIRVDEILNIFNIENITGAVNTLMSMSSFVFRMALALISSIYFMIEGPKFKIFVDRLFRALMSGGVHGVFMKYARNVNEYFKRYIRCQVLDALILGIIMTIVTSLLGVRYAFTLGPMLGFANLIPYFGSIFGTIIAIVVIIFTDGAALGLLSAVVLLVVQQIDANFIFPRLLGDSMKVSPLLVIIAIAIGNAYYGIIGMIVAIPIITVLKNILDDILFSIEEKKRPTDTNTENTREEDGNH